MNIRELIEKLAAAEHASWARWQEYVHSLCEKREDGALVIPASRVAHWEREIAAPYADLSEREKQYDRDEVAHILPIIFEYAAWIDEAAEHRARNRKAPA